MAAGGGILLIAVLVSTVCLTQGQLPNVRDFGNGFIISWGISATTPAVLTVSVSVEQPEPVWLAVGWHPVGSSDPAMTKADIVVADFNSSKLVVTDRFSNTIKNGFSPPLLDTTEPFPGGVDNILRYEGSQQAYATPTGPKVMTTFTFTRLCVTNDTKADWPVAPGKQTVIMAHGKANGFGFHGPGNAFMASIDFFEGTTAKVTSTAETYIQWHACFMFAAFGIILSLGAFIGRYMRKNQWWFWLHFTTQVTALVFMIVGLAMAILAVENGTGDHFADTHPRLGLATLLLALVVVPILGLIAHYFRDPTRTSAPIFPNMTHYWLGRATIVLGYVTIFLGLDLFNMPNVTLAVFGLLLIFYLAISVAGDLFKTLDGKHFLSRFLPHALTTHFELTKKEGQIQHYHDDETDPLVGG